MPRPVMLKKLKLKDSMQTYLQDLLELTPPKGVLFIIRDWNAKVGSQETCGVTGKWPWSTEWSRAKANRVLPRECTGHSKHPLPTTQKTPHGHHQMVDTEIRLIIFFTAKDGKALYSQPKKKKSPGADCGSYHELLIGKYRLKLKRVGKTTRLLKYDLNESLMIIQWK